MRPVPMSPIRRLLMAWFDDRRYSPYVSVNVAVPFTPMRDYLDALRERTGARVSVQALLIAAIARLYVDFPQANARIVGGQIFQPPGVGVAAPVNLIGHEGEERMPLSMMVVENAERLSLREVAEANSRGIQGERGGSPKNPFVKMMLEISEKAPLTALRGAVEALYRFHDSPAMVALSWRVAPASVGISNVGATFGGKARGVLFRGGSISLPTRPVHVGSLFGVAAVQDEVVPVDGVPAVRPMLPLLYVFDHRLFDGYLASRILLRLGEILADPAAEFGPDGDQVRR